MILGWLRRVLNGSVFGLCVDCVWLLEVFEFFVRFEVNGFVGCDCDFDVGFWIVVDVVFVIVYLEDVEIVKFDLFVFVECDFYCVDD